MQAFSGFSWMPDFMQSQNHDKMACTKPHPTPVVRIPPLNTLKRKKIETWRSPSPSPAPESSMKRQRISGLHSDSAHLENASLASAVATFTSKLSLLPDIKQEVTSDLPTLAGGSEDYEILKNSLDEPQNQADGQKTMAATGLAPAVRARVIDKIEAQIDLELLLKHNELRLIEQELAKCQVALEQMRRCHVIPYPGYAQSPVTAEQISTGSGPAVEPRAGLTHPEHPTPWGVTDGPYTRHYARWLIPDAAFDPTPPPPLRQHVARKSVGGRSIRRAEAEKTPSLSTRAPRTSVASPLYALPSSYAVLKDRNSPLVATRPSDGTLVRLVCKFCGKDNVSSMQGFLNHCRIQHKHEYTSHGAAADDCGVPTDEGGKSAVSTTTMQLPTPVSATVPMSSRPLVHPYIVGLPPDRRQSLVPATLGSRPIISAQSYQELGAALARPVASHSHQVRLFSDLNPGVKLGQGPFVPSSLTPKLSALLERRGASGSLQSLVESAKNHADFDNICEHFASDDEEDEIILPANSKPAEQILSKPRSLSKPKFRRSSVQQSHASAGPTPSVPLRIRTNSKPALSLTAMLRESLATDTPASLPNVTSTVDFADPNFGPIAMSLHDAMVSPTLPSTVTPTRSEHSPMSIDQLDGSPQSSQDDIVLDGLSPHTIETDPGLVSDNGEEEDDDMLTFATSSVNGEEATGDASSSLQHDSRDVDVRVRRHDGEHEQRRSSQDLGEHQADGVKSSEASIGLHRRDEFVSVEGGGRSGGRGRARAGFTSETNRGKGDSKRRKASI